MPEGEEYGWVTAREEPGSSCRIWPEVSAITGDRLLTINFTHRAVTPPPNPHDLLDAAQLRTHAALLRAKLEPTSATGPTLGQEQLELIHAQMRSINARIDAITEPPRPRGDSNMDADGDTPGIPAGTGHPDVVPPSDPDPDMRRDVRQAFKIRDQLQATRSTITHNAATVRRRTAGGPPPTRAAGFEGACCQAGAGKRESGSEKEKGEQV